MRPFERLRYLARATDEDDATLLEEAADCLAGFADDPMGVVIACRRLLAYHPTVTTLWWLCAKVLSAADPGEGAWEAWREWRRDPTPARLAGALPFPHDAPVAVGGWPDVARDGLADRIDLDILAVRSRDDPGLSRRLRASVQMVRVVDGPEMLALTPTHFLVAPVATGGGRIFLAPGTGALTELAREAGSAVWLMVPRGVALPARLLQSWAQRVDAVGDAGYEEVAPTDFDAAIGPEGLEAGAVLAHRADCAPAPELLRLD